MRRRELVIIGAAAVAWPVSARAQKPVPVIGFLSSVSPGPSAPLVAAFQRGLRKTGYVEGQNVLVDYRWAEGNYDRLPAMAADLVGRKVDLIVAGGGPASAFAAKTATATLPVVFVIGDDPVATGLVASLSRPGGNLTGVSFLLVELMPKLMEQLLELVPRAGAIALLVNPNNSNAERITQGVEGAARAKGLHLPVVKAGTDDEIDAAFATVVQLHPDALLMAPTRS
jgi:ABC-type uncharacterized transport system substrate-binding protein